MDAAVAAAMSDPERNPHFRRRWVEETRVTTIAVTTPPAAIGSFGLVLREALDRHRRATAEQARAAGLEDCPR
ncbi:hypothetical protein [Roseomonas rosulenta]|uniref:hypothetical protein n=1 Tax=Roseomonas rosulenta TaxID=2748667 RepID=UPI0018DFA55B|nr:hypothetical protein [Roseomonas rosulenta]